MKIFNTFQIFIESLLIFYGEWHENKIYRSEYYLIAVNSKRGILSDDICSEYMNSKYVIWLMSQDSERPRWHDG